MHHEFVQSLCAFQIQLRKSEIKTELHNSSDEQTTSSSRMEQQTVKSPLLFSLSLKYCTSEKCNRLRETANDVATTSLKNLGHPEAITSSVEKETSKGDGNMLPL